MSYTMLIFPDNDFALSRTLLSRQVDGVRGERHKKNALFVAVNEKNSYLCPKICVGQLYLDYC